MSEDNKPQAFGEMPKYKCHKEVLALKILGIELDVDLAQKENRETDGGALLSVEEPFDKIKVGHDFIKRMKHTEEDKGYYVVYEGGYKSWSPTKAFEDGYVLI